MELLGHISFDVTTVYRGVYQIHLNLMNIQY